jgi:hypothetical protein
MTNAPKSAMVISATNTEMGSVAIKLTFLGMRCTFAASKNNTRNEWEEKISIGISLPKIKRVPGPTEKRRKEERTNIHTQEINTLLRAFASSKNDTSICRQF